VLIFDPEITFGRAARIHCLKTADLICDIIASSPTTPRGATGDLARSYSARPTPEGAEIVSNVSYWRYVEYGVGRGPEQPHVRTAIEAVRWLYA